MLNLWVWLWCHHIIFHIPSPSVLFVITMKLKARYRIHAAAILLFNIVQKDYFNRVSYFLKIHYNTKFHDHALCGASVTPSQKLAQLLCWHYWWGGLQWHGIHTEFMNIHNLVWKLLVEHGCTHTWWYHKPALPDV